MKRILVTGANGFIARCVISSLKDSNQILALDMSERNEGFDVDFVVADICDYGSVKKIIEEFKPEIVIHCAGIAHQALGGMKKENYFNVNSDAALNIAVAAQNANPDVYFIFLSSICVYGEQFDSKKAVSENSEVKPSSDYAMSKLEAEKKLIELYDNGEVRKLDILRLAPVYDSSWSLNLDKRVFFPKKIFFVKFGSGKQKMSAVSRKNLSDFIAFRAENCAYKKSFCNIFNVCDKSPYSFEEIINVFRKSQRQPTRFVVKIPLSFVWVLTRFAGFFLKGNKSWLYACYDKVAKDLVFDNSKMIETGFCYKHDLKSTF